MACPVSTRSTRSTLYGGAPDRISTHPAQCASGSTPHKSGSVAARVATQLWMRRARVRVRVAWYAKPLRVQRGRASAASHLRRNRSAYPVRTPPQTPLLVSDHARDTVSPPVRCSQSRPLSCACRSYCIEGFSNRTSCFCGGAWGGPRAGHHPVSLLARQREPRAAFLLTLSGLTMLRRSSYNVMQKPGMGRLVGSP